MSQHGTPSEGPDLQRPSSTVATRDTQDHPHPVLPTNQCRNMGQTEARTPRTLQKMAPLAPDFDQRPKKRTDPHHKKGPGGTKSQPCRPTTVLPPPTTRTVARWDALLSQDGTNSVATWDVFSPFKLRNRASSTLTSTEERGRWDVGHPYPSPLWPKKDAPPRRRQNGRNRDPRSLQRERPRQLKFQMPFNAI